jgi:hypothetical protein
MTMFNAATDRIREAIQLVKANPAAVKAIDEAEAAESKRRDAEAKRRVDLEAKLAARVPERAAQLIADYQRREIEALHAAATALAAHQLEAELGLVPAELALHMPTPVLLPESLVEAQRRKLFQTGPVPWRKGQPADVVRSEQARLAAAKPAARTADDVEQLIAERKAELHERRQRELAARKAELGLPGYPQIP